jgi:hypothetical protein
MPRRRRKSLLQNPKLLHHQKPAGLLAMRFVRDLRKIGFPQANPRRRTPEKPAENQENTRRFPRKKEESLNHRQQLTFIFEAY